MDYHTSQAKGTELRIVNLLDTLSAQITNGRENKSLTLYHKTKSIYQMPGSPSGYGGGLETFSIERTAALCWRMSSSLIPGATSRLSHDTLWDYLLNASV